MAHDQTLNPTSKSQELFERAKKIFPGGVHSPVRAYRGVGGTPPFIASARGAEMTDVDGNRYTDYCMSWGPLIFGHGDPDVLEAVHSAIERGSSFGTAEPYSLELGEILTRSLPWLERLRFVNSGTEAVMSAVRVARAATERSKILKFDGCYHGHADSLLVRAGSGLAEMSSPDSAGVPQSIASETLVCPLDDSEALRAIFDKRGTEIAAVILEPLPANNGLLIQRESWIREVVALARASGALVIFDEVISGFRVVFGGMAERLGIKPDLVTYGKILGGGFPVGAYGGRADLMSLVAPEGPVYQAGTLSANPVAMAAGLAMVKKLQNHSPYLNLETMGREIVGRLSRISSAVPVTFQSEGSIFWAVFGAIDSPDGCVRRIEQIPSIHKQTYARVFHSLLKSGIALAPSAFEVGFLSTAHTSAHIDQLESAWDRALQEISTS